MKAFKLFTIIATLFIAISATAQTAPVRWRTTAKMTSPTEGVVTVRAIITDGWHLYDTKLPKGGPVATDLNFTKSTGIKWLDNFKPSAKPVSSHDASFDMTLRWWEKDVTFTRRFKITSTTDAVSIEGCITYMTCNGQSCNPPKKQTIKLGVKPYVKK